MITEHFIKVRKDVLSDGKDLGRLESIQESDLKKILFLGVILGPSLTHLLTRSLTFLRGGGGLDP